MIIYIDYMRDGVVTYTRSSRFNRLWMDKSKANKHRNRNNSKKSKQGDKGYTFQCVTAVDY